ncbi:MAG: aldolase/citrate lyase family protein [Alphaproteobacteria bacterium]|jgi:2-keto-3-deoxy-L-rhamnonate aldolase RhmA|nr:aldolase/citrate lyase family protein [Alphaproteobacteria bacterium]MDP6516881.1 aldolase/citrate lyase family protein [Alphaproteobacteria bacterium]
MTGIRNFARERLEAGELALGIGLRQARTADTGKIMKTCGFDWLFIDMEHNAMSVNDAVQISIAGQDAGITPVVRVPGFQHFHATRVLDGGAHGIVFPHVDTPETAAELVSNCKYPPLGRRSVVGALPQIDFESMPVGEAAARINAASLIVIMLESPEAIDNVEKMAAVPGVDVLLVGTGDLCMEMGIPGQTDHPKVAEVFERMIAACRENGVYPGLGGVYDPPQMERYIGMGMRFILASNDLALMMAAGRERTRFLRGIALSGD